MKYKGGYLVMGTDTAKGHDKFVKSRNNGITVHMHTQRKLVTINIRILRCVI